MIWHWITESGWYAMKPNQTKIKLIPSPDSLKLQQAPILAVRKLGYQNERVKNIVLNVDKNED